MFAAVGRCGPDYGVYGDVDDVNDVQIWYSGCRGGVLE